MKFSLNARRHKRPGLISLITSLGRNNSDLNTAPNGDQSLASLYVIGLNYSKKVREHPGFSENFVN
jgi:hypothetical protein